MASLYEHTTLLNIGRYNGIGKTDSTYLLGCEQTPGVFDNSHDENIGMQ
jgi:hypothetical protein